MPGKEVKRLVVGDRDLVTIQDNLAQPINELLQCPLFDGRLVTFSFDQPYSKSVTGNINKVFLVAHGLERVPIGYILVKNVGVYNLTSIMMVGPTDLPEWPNQLQGTIDLKRHLVLRVSGPTPYSDGATLTFWVF